MNSTEGWRQRPRFLTFWILGIICDIDVAQPSLHFYIRNVILVGTVVQESSIFDKCWRVLKVQVQHTFNLQYVWNTDSKYIIMLSQTKDLRKKSHI